jgi:crotonobetainyl-CoA:carnitine CoA-transferase CaiB-like acyl-CoA transferase
MQGVVPRFYDTPGAVRHTGRPLGADNQQVYGDVLGLDPARLEELRKKGVI